MMKFLIKYCYEKELLNLKGSKLGQILGANKTGFHRLSHKLRINQSINYPVIPTVTFGCSRNP